MNPFTLKRKKGDNNSVYNVPVLYAKPTESRNPIVTPIKQCKYNFLSFYMVTEHIPILLMHTLPAKLVKNK